MSTHNVDINVNANTKGAEKSLGYLQSLMSEFGKLSTSKIAGLLGAAAVAKMAFDKVSEAISKNIATAKQVSNLAIKFNIDPKAMHSMKMAADDAGVSVRALTMAMKQMGKYAEKGMGSKEIQINFKQLGIEADKLADIQAKPAKFLPEIAKSLMEIGDENQRAAAGALLLGRQYQMLLPLIEDLGTSEEARAKFLDNEAAMTDEQIAANKEISKIQNDMNDQFEKMVASTAPLLNWAMNFVNFLAQGVGFIKDMIFETEQARKEREEKQKTDVARGVLGYQQDLELRQKEGKLSPEEQKEIEEAGSIQGLVAKNAKAASGYAGGLQKLRAYEDKSYMEKEFHTFHKTDTYKQYQKNREQFINARDKGDFNMSEGFQRRLGIKKVELSDTEQRWYDTNKSNLDNPSLREAYLAKLGDSEKGKKIRAYVNYRDAQDRFATAGSSEFDAIASGGAEENAKKARARLAKASEEKNAAEMRGYRSLRKSQAAVMGQYYDEASDKSMSKAEYEALLRSRGQNDEQIALKIKTFEDEGTRAKREKQEKRSARALGASERKLYVGDASEGNMVSGELDDISKAEDALLDIQMSKLEAQEDLNEQIEIMSGMEKNLKKLKTDEVENAAQIASIESQLAGEMQKRNELQIKVNQSLLQEIQGREAVRKANEKAYWEEKKHQDDLKAMKTANVDHEKNLKYKLMQSEGATREQISQAKLVDESKRYEEMLNDYKKEYNELMTNKDKGKKSKEKSWVTGEYEHDPLSDTERSRLEEMSKKMDAQKRTIMDAAFDLGKGDTGRVTDMRRIGGGGMEYGGLANTARSQLEEARKHTVLLQQAVGVMRDKDSTIYGENLLPRSYTMPSLLPSKEAMVGSDALAMPAIPKTNGAPKINPRANGGIFGGKGPKVDEFGRELW
jgi:hypothetical protein